MCSCPHSSLGVFNVSCQSRVHLKKELNLIMSSRTYCSYDAIDLIPELLLNSAGFYIPHCNTELLQQAKLKIKGNDFKLQES